MTAARPRVQDGQSSTQPERGETEQQGEGPQHSKSLSEGQSRSRAILRRTDSSPAPSGSDAQPAGLTWSSSLWGFGSWLDPALSGGIGANKGKRRARSQSTSSKQWDYPPGESVDEGNHTPLEAKSRRRRRKRKSATDDTSTTPTSETHENATAEAPAAHDDTHSSDESSSVSGSSTSSDEDAARLPMSPSSRLEMSSRLLFANRIFTPFQHPSLTASVPNLPSEVGLTSVGTAGLGGMEDIDTVDFEGGESDSDDDGARNAGAILLADGRPVTPPARARTADPTSSQRRLRRSATASLLTTPTGGKHIADAEEDYFGPRAVQRESGRRAPAQREADSDGVEESSNQHSSDIKSGEERQDVHMASAQLQSVMNDKDEQSALPTDAVSESITRVSSESAPPPYVEAQQQDLPSTSVTTTQNSSTKTARPSSLLPPPRWFASGPAAERPPRIAAPATARGAETTHFLRRFLALLRRAILALLSAPWDAIVYAVDSGSGRKRRKVAVGSASAPAATVPQTPERRRSTRASLTFSESKTAEGRDLRSSDKKRPPTPKPERRPIDVSDSEGNNSSADEDEKSVAKQSKPAADAQTIVEEKSVDAMLTPTRASKLLPNPHPVDPMLVHEPKAKRVTGQVPEELKNHRRGFSLSGQRNGLVVVVDETKKPAAGTAVSGTADSAAKPSTPANGPSPSPVPRSAVIHHTPKILVLDLDETLIHSTSRSPTWTALRAQHSTRAEAARNAVSTGGSLLGLEGIGGFLGLSGPSKGRSVRPHMVEVVLDGRSVIYHVYKRPWVDYFLRKVAAWYHVVIFTASVQEYADPVIDWLDQGRGLVAGRLFRDACTYRNGSYLKDLAIVDEDLSRVCLIDNSPASYHLNPSNGIPVEGWTHDPSDEALLDLLPILDSLRFAQDVRHVLGIRVTDQH